MPTWPSWVPWNLCARVRWEKPLPSAAATRIRLGPWEVVFLTMVPLLASAIPVTPAGAGFVEFTLYACLLALPSPFQLTKATAASITFLNRLIDYWLHIVLGIVAWAFRYRLGLYSWQERDPER